MIKNIKLAAVFALALGVTNPALAQSSGPITGSANVAITFNDRSSPVYGLTNNGVIRTERATDLRFGSLQACANHMQRSFNILVSRMPRYENFYARALGRNMDGKLGVSMRARCVDTRNNSGGIMNRDFNQ